MTTPGLDANTGRRIIKLKARIGANFADQHWHEVALLSGHPEIIQNHSRLLRSLSFGDPDYDACILDVLSDMVRLDTKVLDTIDRYIDETFAGKENGAEYVSALPAERTITFSPGVFKVPEGREQPDLVSVMMPFAANFNQVYTSIGAACKANALRCLRADDIWDNATIIQDIFNLVFWARAVIVDFTGKNPNVMYETGIAHTLGKTVIPITQSYEHIPSDMQHHRALLYLPNAEGLAALTTELTKKLSQYAPF